MTEESESMRDQPMLALRVNPLLGLSLVLLVLSSADNGPFGALVKFCWLASVACLTFANIGGALAAYIGSLAIYSPLHFQSWGTPLERPDNYALLIVLAGLLGLAFQSRKTRQRLSTYVLVLLLFVVLHGGLSDGFSRGTFAAVMRAVGIPFLICALLVAVGLRERELDAFQRGMAALGSYIGIVSILEQIHASSWILPPWVSNPYLRASDPSLDEWIGSGRSGGTLLQPAWNGLLLSLIFWIVLLRIRRKGWSSSAVIAMSLCAAGVFFTYTRAAWLGLALSLIWLPGWHRSPRQALVRRVALACIAVVFLVAAGGTARERLSDSDTVYFRFSVWGAGLRLARAHPLLGVGFGNFAPEMSNVEQGFGGLVSNRRDDIRDMPAHNIPLTLLVEFGTVGLLLYTLAFFDVARTARDNARQLWGRSGAAWVCAFAIVYIVNAQFATALDVTTQVVFFGSLGVIAGARQSSPQYAWTGVVALRVQENGMVRQ